MKRRPSIRLLVTAALTLATFSLSALEVTAEQAAKSWEGTWNNRKYNTSGPLKCVATQAENGKWKAVFTGTFMGEKFKYDAVFDSKKGRNQLDLAGKAKIRGDDYQWTGYMKGKQLLGKYRSKLGYYGEFKLKETRSR